MKFITLNVNMQLNFGTEILIVQGIVVFAPSTKASGIGGRSITSGTSNANVKSGTILNAAASGIVAENVVIGEVWKPFGFGAIPSVKIARDTFLVWFLQ